MVDVAVLDTPEVAHAALSPLRREILSELDEPASATEIAARLGLPRQRVNYHMTVLAAHGLVELAEVRRRRGCEERRYRRTGVLVLAPDLIAEPAPEDDLSAAALVAAASDAIRAVGALEAKGKPHPTSTMVAEVRFANPAAHREFMEGVADLAARFDQGRDAGGLTMKVTLLGHAAKGGTS